MFREQNERYAPRHRLYGISIINEAKNTKAFWFQDMLQ